MEYRISDCLDCLEEAGQELAPRGGNAARVRERTLEKLREAAQTAGRLPALQGTEQIAGRLPALQETGRRARPLRVLIAAAAAVLLLCGSVFAAWRLGAFRFADRLGEEGELLDQHAVTYENQQESALPADQGYAQWNRAQAGDYNFVLLELTAADGQLRAEADVSPKDEGTPPFREAGLELRFADYETELRRREMGPWTDRVVLTAPLEEPLAAGTELELVLSGPETEARFHFPLGYSRYEAPAGQPEAEYEPKFGTVAETADYRFSLRTLTVTRRVIYAVLDVEARSDFGLANLDRVPEFAVTNHSSSGSALLLDAQLLESGEGVRRYLLGRVRTIGENKAGDVIGFELLELVEAGDMGGHPYRLFDVEAEALLTEALRLEPQGPAPAEGSCWTGLELDGLNLLLEGQWAQGADYPRVTLVFQDGSRETVLEPGHRSPEALPEGHGAWYVDGGGRRGGPDYLSILLARPLELGELAAVEVDRQVFRVED